MTCDIQWLWTFALKVSLHAQHEFSATHNQAYYGDSDVQWSSSEMYEHEWNDREDAEICPSRMEILQCYFSVASRSDESSIGRKQHTTFFSS